MAQNQTADPAKGKRRARTTVSAVMLLLILAGCAIAFQACRCAPQIAEEPKALLPRADIEGLPNFAKVSDTLYRGGQPTAAGFRKLEAMGIKTIVNLRAHHSDEDRLSGTSLRYVPIPVDAGDIGDKEVAAFLRVALDKRSRPVYVHCWHGSDRTGMAVAAYRMVAEGWPNDRAFAELPRFGFHARVYRGIEKYVLAFDVEAMKRLLGETPAAPAKDPNAVPAHAND